MGCLVWYVLLTVGAGELGLRIWDPSGRYGMVYVTNCRTVGAWLWDPREGFDKVYVTLSMGRRTYSLGPELEVWLVGAGIYCIGV